MAENQNSEVQTDPTLTQELQQLEDKFEPKTGNRNHKSLQ